MRELPIAYGNSCKAKKWSNKTIAWQELGDRLKMTIRTTETVSEYRKMKHSERAAAKDKGGFVGGYLKDGRRQKQNVTCRSMLTLDVDQAAVGFVANMEAKSKYAAYLYSTHSHTPEAPRIRVLVPLTRDVSPEEYVAISRYFAASWGIDQFDKCSFSVNQLMYWPTTPSDGEYLFTEIKGEWLDPDVFLEGYPNWKDFSQLPTTKSESEVKKEIKKKAEDPTTKNNIVGTFCRTYSITDAIDKFLSDVYQPSTAASDRYDYIKGEGAAGVIVYDDKFAYSHHATDPAGGMNLNAFDLVRVHLFYDEDEKKSFHQMEEFAYDDPLVRETLQNEKKEQLQQESVNWMYNLTFDRKTRKVKNTIENLVLILENDEYLKSLVFNQLADGIEISGEVPWNHPSKYWRDQDDAQLICYITRYYGQFSMNNFNLALTKVTDDRSYHPIRDYLKNLPEWDGVPRVDSLLIDYFGAVDTPYVRIVMRKILCAAIKRVFNPGIKFDYVVVFNGPQGIGKSTFISKLGGDWYSDSLNLSDMNDKTAAEKLQGIWIMEIGELAGMKKADIDKVKAFISRQDDKYRASFGRRVTPHLRQCVFFATTNAEQGYLRDITGNRRFWTVKTPGTGAKKPWDMTEEDIQQIWAEAYMLSKKNEPLYLPHELEDYARAEQRDAMEYDDREGLVRDFLEMLLPDNWDEMDSWDRHSYFRERDKEKKEGLWTREGTIRRTKVSNMEIWCECLGNQKGSIQKKDSNDIAAIMTRIEGWERQTDKSERIPIYGRQRLYIRK